MATTEKLIEEARAIGTRTPTGIWKLRDLPAVTEGKTACAAVAGYIIKKEDEAIRITVTHDTGQPILITHGGSCTTIISVEPDAHAHIIERFTAPAEHRVTIALGENSGLTHTTIQEGGYRALKSATVARDAVMNWFELDMGKGQSTVSSVLAGEGASTRNDSIFLGPVHFTAIAEHQAPHTTSRLLTKGILDNNENAIYEGVLRIGEQAVKSDAFQREDCLLIGDGEIKASPRLFIGNEDVTCSHAATVTTADAGRLFYLQSRGIPATEARRMIVRAFIWPVIEDLDSQVRERLLPLLEERLGGL